ncbi:hypothetical protein KR054_010268 [Drosophila jambulina]|nr:hypothetical protein KR054_010268 [Drosophila jambulina]
MKLRNSSNKKKPEKISERKVNPASYPARRIPGNALKRTLEIATNPIDNFWLKKNTSCVRPMNYELYLDKKRSATNEKLRLARNCLMTRDYKNLAKLLASELAGDTVLQRDSYTVFAEYADLLKKFTKQKSKCAKASETQPETEPSPSEADQIFDFNL